jgi:CNT family concentrative nucleoside transporter
MTKYWYCLFFFLFGIFAVHSQNLSKDWSFQSAEKSGEIQNDFSPEDILSLTDGHFEIKSASDDTIKSQGDYLYQNNLLVFFYNPPNDTIRKFRISEISDSSLVFSDNYNTYKFKESPQLLEEVIPVQAAKQIIPSAGFSFSSLWRGLLGMLALLLIAYFFSSNKKAINWKTVLIGLAAQMLLAIGVLKITFIKNIFEFVGKIFVLILDFTRAGSEFLLGGNDEH